MTLTKIYLGNVSKFNHIFLELDDHGLRSKVYIKDAVKGASWHLNWAFVVHRDPYWKSHTSAGLVKPTDLPIIAQP